MGRWRGVVHAMILTQLFYAGCCSLSIVPSKFRFATRAIGLVVEYIVAIDVTRVRFPDGALLFRFTALERQYWDGCTSIFIHSDVNARLQ